MIFYKTKEEIQLMREAGILLAEVKQVVYDAIKPGISTLELDEIAYNEIIKRGAIPSFKGYHGFPGSLCISVNEELIHGIPSKDKILKEGDIVKVDSGLIWKGFHSDSAFTKGVGNITNEDKKLIQVAKDAFYIGVEQIKPGATIGDIEHAIGNYVKKQGYYVPDGFTGHGIGKNLHEDPIVHNRGTAGKGPKIKDGLVICIEPMILQGSKEITILEDKWTVISNTGKNTAHYEHTIAIIDGKPEILTGGI